MFSIVNMDGGHDSSNLRNQCYQGRVVDVDEDNYLAKVYLLPGGPTTGFIRITTQAIGYVEMPSVGTIVKVDFIENNMNLGVISACLYNEKISANKKHPSNEIHQPKAKVGWSIYRHPQSGAEIHFTDKGEYEIFTPDGIKITSKKDIHQKSSTKVYIECDNIYIGKEGSAKKLATVDFINNIFQNHIHIGNLGAPTTTPLTPALFPFVITEGQHYTSNMKGS